MHTQNSEVMQPPGPLLVVLRAPQGCGKTRFAGIVAKATACERVYADEPDGRAVGRDLSKGRRVLVCTNEDYVPADESTPVLRIGVDGAQPAATLRGLLEGFGQSVDALSVMNTPSLSA